MIELGRRTHRFIIDAIIVELKRILRCVNGYGNGSDSGNGQSQIRFILFSDEDVALRVAKKRINHAIDEECTDHIGGSDRFGFESTFAIVGIVRIGLFTIDTVVLFDIFESVGHQASIATFIAEFIRTIDQLLFGE